MRKGKEYTVICNYPSKEGMEKLQDMITDFYVNYYKSIYTPKELEVITQLLGRYIQLENQGHEHEEIKKIILEERNMI